MSTKSILRTLRNAFSFAPYEGTAPGYCTVSAGAPLPPPVLDTINSVKTGKGWQWKGEYYRVCEEGGNVREILMYTSNGGLRVVRIHDSGELISIAPREEPFFLYQALHLSDYHMNL
ncbi:MAG TPA: hypothetical protein VGE66_00565 [Chitinophagaceae bacterium]